MFFCLPIVGYFLSLICRSRSFSINNSNASQRRALARCFQKKKKSSFASLITRVIGRTGSSRKSIYSATRGRTHVKSWALRKIIIRKAKISSLIYILMMLQKKAGTDSNNELYYASGELLNVGTRDK